MILVFDFLIEGIREIFGCIFGLLVFKDFFWFSMLGFWLVDNGLEGIGEGDLFWFSMLGIWLVDDGLEGVGEGDLFWYSILGFWLVGNDLEGVVEVDLFWYNILGFWLVGRGLEGVGDGDLFWFRVVGIWLVDSGLEGMSEGILLWYSILGFWLVDNGLEGVGDGVLFLKLLLGVKVFDEVFGLLIIFEGLGVIIDFGEDFLILGEDEGFFIGDDLVVVLFWIFVDSFFVEVFCFGLFRFKCFLEGDGFKVFGFEREGEVDFFLIGLEIDVFFVFRDGDGDGDEVIFFFIVFGFVFWFFMLFVVGGLWIEVGEEGILLLWDEVCKFVEIWGFVGDGGVFLEGLVFELFEGLFLVMVGFVFLR